jgi:alkylation response protein AidB-like acyl-CoA dehydrogenase
VISFELTEEQAIARDSFQELARDVVRPAAAIHDAQGDLTAPVLQAVRDAGIVEAALGHDASENGPRSRILSCLLLEELGWADASLAVAIGATMGFVNAVVDYGTREQRAAIRGSFGSKAHRGAAIVVQEPGFGARLGQMKTVAVPMSGGYRLSGAKCFVPRLSDCENLLVLARCETDHVALIVSSSTPGVEICGTPGTLGLRGVRPSEVRFHDVVLPSTARLGGGHVSCAQPILDAARIGTAAILTGLARAVFEHITPYTKERVVHGSALAQKQSVAFRLADMRIDIPAMRWVVWKGALSLEKGRDAARDARLAQIYCGARCRAVADEGVQLMGGHGYMRENPVERWYRDAHTLSLIEGLTGI